MSEWCQIENGFLTVQLTTKGAEMKRLFHRAWNRELLWSGEEKIWQRSAPILFPVVGKLVNDEFIFQEKRYTLPQHGFARDMDFECTLAGIHECEFVLAANKETFQHYPFLFELKVHYALDGEKLSINYIVKNSDRQDIYFSIGSHPGFATEHVEDFEILFEKEEEAYFLAKDGLLDMTKKVMFKDNRLELSADIFAKDALVFKNPRSKCIDLINKVKNQVIRLSGLHVPYLGIWSKGKAPFVCIEPWYGVSDSVNSNQRLENKEGIIKLEEGREFSFSYAIEMLHS
jgi:galactose mutarotase-like enzyme